MSRLISIKRLRSPGNIEGCYEVFVHRPIPKREKALAGTKKMNFPSEKIDIYAMQQQARGSDKMHHRLVQALLFAPVFIMIIFLILVALR